MDHLATDRFEVFCETVFPEEQGILKELSDFAKDNDVPIIRPAARRYLRWLLATICPARILELGTAIGFSAILMAQAAESAYIVTVENYEKRIPIAKENIKRAGCSERIRLMENDAMDAISLLAQDEGESFDLVFVDAAKGQYAAYLEAVMPFLHRGSVVLFDNVLAQESGTTLDSRYAIERRDRTIHQRMRELIRDSVSDSRFAADLSEAGDGMLTLTVL